MARTLRRRAVRLKAPLPRRWWSAASLAVLASVGACTIPEPLPESETAFVPSEVIDLGALVTEDLPDRVWGKALLEQRGYTRSNIFEVIPNETPGSNAYYTLFNHGGPHVDAPNHYGG